MIRATNYDISDAVSFTLPNHVDGILKQCYPNSNDKFHPVQLCINRSKGGDRPQRWIEHALNDAAELASFWTPSQDDPSLIHAYSHCKGRTAIQFALRGARWMLGRIGQGASPISQDSIAEGIAYAAEHPDGIAPERFVHYVFDSASSIRSSGDTNCGNWTLARGCWIGGRRHGESCARLIGLANGANAGFGTMI
jgi:hypothetical protein